MIESSGKSLLDIVDHLLEHAHATGSSSERRGNAKSIKQSNKVTKNRDGSVPSTSKHNTDNNHQPPCDVALLTEEVLNTALWATPKPSPPSEEERRSITSPDQTSAECIKVILEIDPSASGQFHVNSGAWSRIVQNLACNALKYTDPDGYLKVSLSAADAPSNDSRTHSTTASMVELVCLDSGRGMSRQFQKFGLWQAFSQENSGSQGTGLGLSLVHGIVKEMGGTIDVQSTKGIGTAIKVRLPLRRHGKGSSSSPDDASFAVSERLKSCTCAISGFEGDGDRRGRSVKANAVLRKSIANTCENYGVRVLQDVDGPMHDDASAQSSQQADIIILSERKAIQMSQSGLHNNPEKACAKFMIVLCNSLASSRILPNIGSGVMAIAQPLGPRKLLRALTSCLEKIVATGSDDRYAHRSSIGDQSPLVLTSRPDFTPKSSYFGAASQSAQTKPQASSSGLTTLLVDDNDINLTLLRAYMNKNKHSFVCASDGLEAFNAYKNTFTDPALVLPTLILMDLTMPRMSGLESTRQIRAFERAKSIKPASMIIALTAMSTSEAKQEAFGSGVDHFMTKPVRLKALGQILEKHMQDRQIGGRIAE